MQKIITFLILALVSSSVAQVKYSRNNEGVLSTTLSFSQSEYNNKHNSTIGGQINFTKDGRVGLGFVIAHSNPSSIIGVGINAEVAIYRPFPDNGFGVNLLGAGLVSISNPFGTTYSNASSGETGAVGLEVYYHCAKSGFEVEPFAQFVKSFPSRGIKSINSYAGGLDFIIPFLNTKLFVVTVGAVATDKHQSSLEGGITFCTNLQ
jgi:hypothetical protein